MTLNGADLRMLVREVVRDAVADLVPQPTAANHNGFQSTGPLNADEKTRVDTVRIVAEEGFHDQAGSGRDDLCSRMTKIGMAATKLDEDTFVKEVLENVFVVESQYHKSQTWDDFVGKYRYLVEKENIRFVGPELYGLPKKPEVQTKVLELAERTRKLFSPTDVAQALTIQGDRIADPAHPR